MKGGWREEGGKEVRKMCQSACTRTILYFSQAGKKRGWK